MNYGFIILGVLSVVVIVSWIVLASKFAQDDQVAPVKKVQAKTKPTMPSDSELNKMTKVQLEEFGRTVGVELDKRKTKKNMISELMSANI